MVRLSVLPEVGDEVRGTLTVVERERELEKSSDTEREVTSDAEAVRAVTEDNNDSVSTDSDVVEVDV